MNPERATWLLDLTGGDYPSPTLLQRAADGPAHLRRLAPADLAAALAEIPPGGGDVFVCAQGPERAAAQRVLSQGGAQALLLDPSSQTALAGAGALPAYHLAPGPCHAEVDMGPPSAPLHPGVLPSPMPISWEARLSAMVAGVRAGRDQGPGSEATLHLNDPAAPLTMDRLRGAAELVRRCIRERDALPQLHLRAWPADLLSDERLVPHLSLLPLASLDLLAGGLGPAPSPAHDPRGLGLAEALSRLSAGGLGHLCAISLLLAMPGEDGEQCIGAVQSCLRLAAEAGVRRVRLSLWLDAPHAPESPEEQTRLFLASHPDWHPLEHRGIFDFVALMQAAVPAISLVGPGLLPGWEPPEAGEGEVDGEGSADG
jgi:hypothetical protein